MPLVKKTIKCKIVDLTNIKRKQLEKEYNNLQKFLHGKENLELYSANKQQAKRFYRKVKDSKEYPLSIRKDLIDIRKTNNKLATYWVKVPVKSRWGGLKVAIKSQPFPFEKYEICESKILKKNNEFWIHLTVQKEVKIKKSYSSILTVDLGQKVTTAVSVAQQGIQVRFYGKEIRGIRRHYQHLRKQLGKKKLLKKIKEVGHKEKRIINQKLHEISKAIVSISHQRHSIIVLGDLKGIRENGKGKKFNRILSNWAYHKLTKYIEYKAKWKGIKVIKINERETSHTCYRCGSKGKRPKQAVFNCPNCGLKDMNADVNGAINIAKKFLSGYILDRRALSGQALNLSDMVSVPVHQTERLRKEAPSSRTK